VYEAEVAVGDERAHAARLGEGLGLGGGGFRGCLSASA